MKSLLLICFQAIGINAFSQIQPVASGLYHWNDAGVKKEEGRGSRKILEGSPVVILHLNGDDRLHRLSSFPCAKLFSSIRRLQLR